MYSSGDRALEHSTARVGLRCPGALHSTADETALKQHVRRLKAGVTEGQTEGPRYEKAGDVTQGQRIRAKPPPLDPCRLARQTSEPMTANVAPFLLFFTR